MQDDHKPICGAKTRFASLCRNRPMANGRCRMHGGLSTGPKDTTALEGNQNARKHGIWSRFFTAEDVDFLEADPAERLAMLQGAAEVQAFRAHKMATGGEGVDDTANNAFNRTARTAANLVRTRLALAEKAAEGITLDGQAEAGDADGPMTNDERVSKLADLLDTGAAPGTGGGPGPSDVAAVQSGPDRGPAQSG